MKKGTEDFYKLLENEVKLKAGPVNIIHELYLATRDFNVSGSEQSIEDERIKVLSFKIGDIILMTVKPNQKGWFEGYRASDPLKLCGISHTNCIKRIHFQ